MVCFINSSSIRMFVERNLAASHYLTSNPFLTLVEDCVLNPWCPEEVISELMSDFKALHTFNVIYCMYICTEQCVFV